MSFSQFQSIRGPSDPLLKSSEIEGYQPVSRIGEVVINAFVDAYEFSRLGAANRAFAAACGPVLGELWSAEMILQFAGAYDDCVSGREATAGPSYTC